MKVDLGHWIDGLNDTWQTVSEPIALFGNNPVIASASPIFSAKLAFL
jgi:hypothetical protein